MRCKNHRSKGPETVARTVAALAVCMLVLGAGGYSATGAAHAQQPRNVILCIGDGMGFEQVKAAGMYATGAEGSLSFEGFAYRGEVTTHSANASVTDSAAAATAMATGVKVNNGVISLADPGDKHELETLLEYFKASGKRTGLVTTTDIAHATPAGFGAHETSRNNYAGIVSDYLTQTRPYVLFGGAGYLSPGSAAAEGYTVVEDSAELAAVDTETVSRISGQFGGSHLPYEYGGSAAYQGPDALPHLSEMTGTALKILDNDPDGFFLVVEGGRIDHAGHDNQLERNVFETIEFSNTVQVVLDWIQTRPDTLVIVTADHETGGMTVEANKGAGEFPVVSWSTGGHTGVNVPVYATGVNAELVHGVMDNTDIFKVAKFDGYTLSQVVSLLQMLCGNRAVPAFPLPDVDRDGETGMEEVSFMLQKISGTR